MTETIQFAEKIWSISRKPERSPVTLLFLPAAPPTFCFLRTTLTLVQHLHRETNVPLRSVASFVTKE